MASYHLCVKTGGKGNGCTYREIEIALPRELKPAHRLELVRDFVRQAIGDRHAYQFAIHNPKAASSHMRISCFLNG